MGVVSETAFNHTNLYFGNSDHVSQSTGLWGYLSSRSVITHIMIMRTAVRQLNMN